MIRNPCYDSKTNTDCENRCSGCSTLCALWHDYVQRRDDMYKKRAKAAEAEGAMIEHQLKLKHKMNQRKHKKG